MEPQSRVTVKIYIMYKVKNKKKNGRSVERRSEASETAVHGARGSGQGPRHGALRMELSLNLGNSFSPSKNTHALLTHSHMLLFCALQSLLLLHCNNGKADG
ncbi:hypothetical protein SRHO_G00093250 [Serrasalmus rhombeus]